MARRPSMADVAASAHVSHQTVSRVLNDHPHVRPSTRQRVLDAIAELGYAPNGAARALATRKTRTIGLLAAGTDLHGPASTLLSLEQAARAAGYYLSVTTLSEYQPARVQEALAHFRGQLVEAVAVIAPTHVFTPVVEQMSGATPIVLICSDEQERAAVATVGIDQRAGSRAVMDLLAREGHERIAFVAGPRLNYDADLRLETWQAALAERGLPTPPVYLGSWEPEDGYQAGMALAQSILAAPHQAPTAIFVANDHMAIGLLRACAEAGVRVPEDLSVVGFDNIPGAGHLLPPLTTVHQPFDQLGRATVEALVAAIEGQPQEPVRLLAPHLVERVSHGPARR